MSRTACTSSCRKTRSWWSWPRATASSCATCAGLLTDLDVPTGANLEVPAKIVLTVGSDCAIGKMTVSLELERRRAAAGSRRASCRPARPGSRSLAGGSPSMRSSPTSSPAPPSGWSSRARARGRAAARRGAGSGHSPRVLRRHAGADPRLRAAPVRPLPPWPARPRSRAIPGTRCSRSRSSSTCTSAFRFPPGRQRWPRVALNTRLLDDDGAARAAIAAAEAETGLVADDPVRFGAERLLDAIVAAG